MANARTLIQVKMHKVIYTTSCNKIAGSGKAEKNSTARNRPIFLIISHLAGIGLLKSRLVN